MQSSPPGWRILLSPLRPQYQALDTAKGPQATAKEVPAHCRTGDSAGRDRQAAPDKLYCFRLENRRVGYGTTWVNAMDCRFEDNQVGFCFNAEGTVVTHTQYANNEFFHNGTAVLLKSVPAESPLSFPGSVFEDNDTDIDNRCGREVNISQTTFR